MKKRMIVFLFMVFWVSMFSQNFGGTDQINAPIYYNLSTIEGNKKYAQDFYKEVEGSPYIFKDFVLSEIVGVKTKMMLRYNAYEDVVEVEKAPNEIYPVLKEMSYNTFLLNNNLLKLRLVNIETNSGAQSYLYLFEIFSNNNLKVLRRDKVDFIEGRIPRTSFELGNKPKFTAVKHSYYLEIKDKNPVVLPNSKAKLLAMFPQQESDLKKFLKDNNIILSKEKDILAVAQFLSILQY